MNQHYKTLIAILSSAVGEQHWNDWILSALSGNDTPRSKSTVHGWSQSIQNKNFRRMSADDLLDVLNAVYRKLNDEH